jgi:menaquinone-9 beta-reductase
VRGEWIAPWGVAETRRLDIYPILRAAGGHHLTRHITFDESVAPAEAEAHAQPLEFLPGIAGPLCIRHPHHCQTLFDAAAAAGATALREADVTEITTGATPSVRYTHAGVEHRAAAPLLVGADGRMSPVREKAGIALHQDAPHHWFAGLLIDGAHAWADDLQAIGTEENFAFLAFPQGGGRVRVYGGWNLDEKRRFAGPEGPRRFLDAFRMKSAPMNDALAAGEPAGPLYAYFNNDSWTDAPFAPGVVLVGDAAGWNDPIIGLGLSITYRDVRIVSDILKETKDWSKVDFTPYAEERAERMRRLRFTAAIQARLDMEFDEAARARRASYHQRAKADPMIKALAGAVMMGPEVMPPDVFTPAFRQHVLGA